jgi:hypothetical protein
MCKKIGQTELFENSILIKYPNVLEDLQIVERNNV